MAIVIPCAMLIVMVLCWMPVASFFGARQHGKLIRHLGGGTTGLLAALLVLLVAAPAPQAAPAAPVAAPEPQPVVAPVVAEPPAVVPAPAAVAPEPPPVEVARAAEPPPAPPAAVVETKSKARCDVAALERDAQKAADAKFGKLAKLGKNPGDSLSPGRTITLGGDLTAAKSSSDVFSAGSANRVVIRKGSQIRIAQRLVERDGRVWYQVHVPATDQWLYAGGQSFTWLADTGRSKTKAKEDWLRAQIEQARTACN